MHPTGSPALPEDLLSVIILREQELTGLAHNLGRMIVPGFLGIVESLMSSAPQIGWPALFISESRLAPRTNLRADGISSRHQIISRTVGSCGGFAS